LRTEGTVRTKWPVPAEHLAPLAPHLFGLGPGAVHVVIVAIVVHSISFQDALKIYLDRIAFKRLRAFSAHTNRRGQRTPPCARRFRRRAPCGSSRPGCRAAVGAGNGSP